MEETDVKFKFYSRIFHVNGDELISNDFIAISELVKNSFDANANRVEIIYEESQGKKGESKGRFIIEDDGDGMDKEIIIDYWMGLAGDYKKELKRKGKTLLGDKGIGRLAASRISNQLIMITRPNEKNIEYKIKIDWNKIFEERYATDYSTKLREDLPKIFLKKCGTKLILENIKQKWNETKLKDLKNHLSRLINPLNPSIDKKIHLTLPEKYKLLSGYIFSSKIIKTPMYSIKGRIDDSGIITFSTFCKFMEESKLKEFVNLKEKIQMEKFAPFQFEYRYWDFDAPLLNKLSNIIDIVKTEIRSNILYHSGVSVYRDNFRVMPYGEKNLDWLDLNTRRIKRLSDYIQNDHIIGAISFSSRDNPELKDQSNREGLDKNIEFQIFKETVIKTISILERFRHIFLIEIKKIKKKKKKKKKNINLFIKKKKKKKKKKKQKIDELLVYQKKKKKITQKRRKEELINVKNIKDDIVNFEKLTSTSDLKTASKEIEKSLVNLENSLKESQKEEEKEIQNEIELVTNTISETKNKMEEIKELKGLCSIGLQAETLIHDGNSILYHLSNVVNDCKDEFKKEENILSKLNIVSNEVNSLQFVLDRISPITKKGYNEKISLNLSDFLKNYINNWKDQLDTDHFTINVDIPQREIKISIMQGEICTIIMNLLDNSIFWLSQDKTNNDKKIVIDIHAEKKDLHLIFSDNGKGVPKLEQKRIFEPRISLKQDEGWGLGLYIIREILDELNGEIQYSDSPLPGANFIIIIPKIVL